MSNLSLFTGESPEVEVVPYALYPGFRQQFSSGMTGGRIALGDWYWRFHDASDGMLAAADSLGSLVVGVTCQNEEWLGIGASSTVGSTILATGVDPVTLFTFSGPVDDCTLTRTKLLLTS